MPIRLKSSQIVAVGARCSSQTYLRRPSNSTDRCSHDAHSTLHTATWFSLFCVIVLLSHVFSRRKLLSECSASHDVTETTSRSLKSISTWWNSRLTSGTLVRIRSAAFAPIWQLVSCSVLNPWMCVVICLVTALKKWGVRYPPLQKVGGTRTPRTPLNDAYGLTQVVPEKGP